MGKKRYTCWHCRTGIVHRLPATCPECDKRLEKEVKKGERKYSRFAAVAIAALLMACGRPVSGDTAAGTYGVNESCIQHVDGALYILQAYVSNNYAGIVAEISAREAPGAVFIDLKPTNISTYYTADVKFVNMACNSGLVFVYRPII